MDWCGDGRVGVDCEWCGDGEEGWVWTVGGVVMGRRKGGT